MKDLIRPTVDFNEIMFESDEDIAKAQEQYEKQVERYIEEKRNQTIIKGFIFSFAILGVLIGFCLIVSLFCITSESTFKSFFYTFLDGLCSLSFYGSIIFLVCEIIKIFKGEFPSADTLSLIVVLLLIGSFHLPKVLGFGTTQIGSFYESHEYKEYYYVEMSREPESVYNRKEYVLPAQIWHMSGGYYIQYLYFNNGGSLNFEDEEESLILNKEVRLSDEEHDTYYITLTDRKSN
jgi:hypothetical protein